MSNKIELKAGVPCPDPGCIGKLIVNTPRRWELKSNKWRLLIGDEKRFKCNKCGTLMSNFDDWANIAIQRFESSLSEAWESMSKRLSV